jgi:hypothetical protein
MLYKELLQLKSENLKLSLDEVNTINDILKKSNIRIKKRKFTPEIIKLKELNNKKKSISSKINQIINKISILNYQDIVIEFLTNINLDDEDYLEYFYEIFLNKIFTENNFAKSFAYFFKDLAYGAKYHFDKDLSLNLQEKYFNELLNQKTRFFDETIFSKEELLNQKTRFFDETKSENLLTFFYHLIENQYYNKDLYHKIFLELYNNNLFYLVYVWLNLNKNNLNKYIFYLEQIDKTKLDNRTNVLLDNFIQNSNNNNINNNINNKISNNINNKLAVEIENILEEYLELNDEDEIKLYIKENLKSYNDKLLFKNMCLKHKNKKINKLIIFAGF